MEKIVMRFNQELYHKQAVIKAAYHFIDRCYIHIDLVDDEFIIDLAEKKGIDVNEVALDFENELLAQTVRFQVYSQTHVLREVLMARAMSSTITGGNSELNKSNEVENVDSLDNILTDWFEKNEKHD